jgi:hypothetical protein
MKRTICGLLLLFSLILLGCQPISITPTIADTSLQQPNEFTENASPFEAERAAPSATSTPVTTLDYTMEGINIRLEVPHGWQADIMDGLLLVEHTASIDDGLPNAGMVVYIFAPPLSEFAVLTGSGNFAYAVLNHVVRMPQRVGRDVSVSDPVSFRWGEYDAAYYLLSGLDVRTMVLAVAVPSRNTARRSLVVCNISVPNDREGVLRMALPFILDGLTIDGIVLEGDLLQALPDPLPFPSLQQETARAPHDAQAVTFTTRD